MVCIYIAGFAWSWGAIGWLIPSEIMTLETRAAGVAVFTAVESLFTFVIGQAFLSMLCGLKYGVFIFFAGWVLIMTIWTGLFVVETYHLPIEKVHQKFQRHWFWKNCIGRIVGPERSLSSA